MPHWRLLAELMKLQYVLPQGGEDDKVPRLYLVANIVELALRVLMLEMPLSPTW